MINVGNDIIVLLLRGKQCGMFRYCFSRGCAKNSLSEQYALIEYRKNKDHTGYMHEN